MTTKEIKGIMEIDSDRGVIYFHASDPRIAKKMGSITLLRICQLPRPIPLDRPLDVTFGYGCDWRES